MGGLKASGRHHSIGIAKERASSKAKIVVISRVWSSCLTVVRVDWILESKLNGLLVSELVSRLYPNKKNKQKEHNQPRANARTTWCKHGMLCGMRYVMHMQDLAKNEWTWPQLGNPRVPLERWGDFGWNRYKEHRNRRHGLEMASNSNMAPVCDKQQVAI